MKRTSTLVLCALFALLCLSQPLSAQTRIYGSSFMIIDDFIEIDPVTGAGTTVGQAGVAGLFGLTYDSNTNTVYAVNHQRLFTINRGTGIATPIGEHGIFINTPVDAGLAFDPNTSTLYMTETGNDNLYTVDTSTGVATSVGYIAVNIGGLGYDYFNNVLYGYNMTANQLVTIDTTTAAVSVVGDLGVDLENGGMDFDPISGNLYATEVNTDTLYLIDKATGAATAIGTGLGAYGEIRGIAIVPEPATIAVVMLAGAAGLFIRRRTP